MKKIGLYHSDALLINETVKEITQFAKKRGLEILQKNDLLKLTEGKDLVLLSLGGDGTFLKASQIALKLDVPILGVNLGNLGFLTDVEGIDVFSAIEALANQAYFKEERKSLKVEYLSKDQEMEFFAINDFVVLRQINSKILQFEVSVNDLLAGKFHSDGFIVSSPTGSTAYSLSVGGPIISPGSEVFLLNFISPHKLSARPLVLSVKDKLSIKILNPGEYMFQRDGESVAELKAFDRLSFFINEKSLKILHIKPKNFFEVLNKKFGWGV